MYAAVIIGASQPGLVIGGVKIDSYTQRPGYILLYLSCEV